MTRRLLTMFAAFGALLVFAGGPAAAALPTVSVPSVTVPTVSIPTVSTPTISVPTVTVPHGDGPVGDRPVGDGPTGDDRAGDDAEGDHSEHHDPVGQHALGPAGPHAQRRVANLATAPGLVLALHRLRRR